MPPTLADQRIVVTGSTGLVGTQLVAELARAGVQVVRAVRRPVSDPHGEVFWDPDAGKIDAAALDGADAVVHLAGENIAGGRWTEKFKQRIRDSRVQGTRLLSEAIAGLTNKPRTFVCASAIGYYGDRGDEVLTESSPPGDDFLADVCREWEAACQPARGAGVRVVNTRIGVVLSPHGGALKKMLTPFKLGVGGRLGNGRQYMSWVALDDVVESIGFILATPEVAGPVNLTAPNPATNLDFTKTLGRVLSRPTVFPLPAFAARLHFGEAADALLLSSTRVLPQALTAAGYQFRYPELEPALRHLLQR
jgi:uncharacterized protein (TIGR01777 family)